MVKMMNKLTCVYQ